jgi:ribonuclease P protein component
VNATAHQCFPRSARVRTSAEYKAVFGGGIRASGACFRLHVAQSEAQALAKLGIAVSKRVDKTAVGRNRIKRDCREFFRQNKNKLVVADYVLVAKPEAATSTGKNRRLELEKLFTRAQTLLSKAAIGTMHGSPDNGAAISRDP